MALFKSGEELRIEGKSYFDSKDYSRALRCFEKAFEKNDNKSLFLIYECYKKLNQIDTGISVLQKHLSNPELSTVEKIHICHLLTQNNDLRAQYLEQAANLGDPISQNSLFRDSCNRSDLPGILHYGEQILNNTSATEELKDTVYQYFLNHAQHEESLGNNYYSFSNGSIGRHTYISLLHDVIDRPPSQLRNKAIIALVRYNLVERYYRKKAEDNTQFFEKYKETCELGHGIVALLEEVYEEVDLARYYLALIYTFGFGITEVDYTTAAGYLSPLLGKDYRWNEYAPGAQQLKLFLNNKSVLGLQEYIRYRSDWNFNDAIIGNQSFKDKVVSQLSILDRQFNQWDYTSAFLSFITKKRSLDSNIWIFDGEPSNAKKTLAQEYCRMLASHCFMNQVFKVIDPFKINAYAMAEAKYGYIKDIIDGINPWHCCILYFDNPYLVSENSSGFEGLNSILRYLIHLLDEQKDRIIVLILGGDGDRIKHHLVSLGIPEYKYSKIPFHGYSANEAIELLHLLNRQAAANGANIILDQYVLRKIHHLVSLKNSAGNRNISFDVVSFIYASLRNHFFTAEDTKNLDYEAVFFPLERTRLPARQYRHHIRVLQHHKHLFPHCVGSDF